MAAYQHAVFECAWYIISLLGILNHLGRTTVVLLWRSSRGRCSDPSLSDTSTSGLLNYTTPHMRFFLRYPSLQCQYVDTGAAMAYVTLLFSMNGFQFFLKIITLTGCSLDDRNISQRRACCREHYTGPAQFLILEEIAKPILPSPGISCER